MNGGCELKAESGKRQVWRPELRAWFRGLRIAFSLQLMARYRWLPL
jgi:hypothetical protein